MIPLPFQLQQHLKRLDLTVCTAESLTAGLVSSSIASVSGASAYLRGGVCAYTLDAKADVLGVDRALASACCCVSEVVAEQMAQGVLGLFKADIAIATTGYAEPSAGLGVETPYAFVCVKMAGASAVILVEGPGLGRTEMQAFVTERALQLVVGMLRHL